MSLVAHAISRRRFLVGAGAAGAVVVGGGGVAVATHRHGVRRFLHAHGVLGGPDLPVPSTPADVHYGEFDSASARKRVGYGVYRPASTPEAALFCLHGRGGSHRDPFEDLGLHRFVASAGLNWLITAVDGGESFWHARADGSDTQRLVIDELMPMVLADDAAGAKPVVIGWSMGALGALLIGEQHPGLFSAVVASSPSIWRSASAAATGAFDDDTDFARNDALAHASLLSGDQTRIDCGSDDVFADASADLIRSAPGTSGGIRDGYHESPTWRSFIPDQLDFIAARIRTT